MASGPGREKSLVEQEHGLSDVSWKGCSLLPDTWPIQIRPQDLQLSHCRFLQDPMVVGFSMNHWIPLHQNGRCEKLLDLMQGFLKVIGSLHDCYRCGVILVEWQ
jgi:hypothetical protein